MAWLIILEFGDEIQLYFCEKQANANTLLKNKIIKNFITSTSIITMHFPSNLFAQETIFLYFDVAMKRSKETKMSDLKRSNTSLISKLLKFFQYSLYNYSLIPSHVRKIWMQ